VSFLDAAKDLELLNLAGMRSQPVETRREHLFFIPTGGVPCLLSVKKM
jgi:hypothetical protein